MFQKAHQPLVGFIILIMLLVALALLIDRLYPSKPDRDNIAAERLPLDVLFASGTLIIAMLTAYALFSSYIQTTKHKEVELANELIDKFLDDRRVVRVLSSL